jgi:multidrug transporter EmrE-like cation transporter
MRELIGDLRIKTCLVNQNPAETCQVFGKNFSGQLYALGHLPASVVSPTLIGQPILTAILAIPMLGEIPNATQWIGGAVALAGIYIVNQSHLQTQKEIPNA